jgi:UDP-3-O-acyl-N-acetylglucosamine deacetylase
MKETRYQHTIRRDIAYDGVTLLGGCPMEVRISPADANKGITFFTPTGSVHADLRSASAYKRYSILLEDKLNGGRVLQPEHFLATLFAYGIDNADIHLRRRPTKSYGFMKACGLATDIEVIPVFGDRELNLCRKIEEAGLEKQDAPLRYITVNKKVGTAKLSFEPREQDGLEIEAETDYPIPGREVLSVAITPENYRDQLASSRMFSKIYRSWMPDWAAKMIVSFWNPSFGVGTGFSRETVFLPTRTKEEWIKQDRYGYGELTRHTIVDRLGAIALLDGILNYTYVRARFSSHRNDLETLRLLSDKGAFVKKETEAIAA